MESTVRSTTVRARATVDLISNISSSEVDDGGIPNPSGRSPSDGRDGKRSPLIKCQKPVFFSTFNTRPLNKSGHLEELVACARKYNIDVIAIQDHRFYHPDSEIEYRTIGNYQLITSSALKNAGNATVGAVALLLAPKAKLNLQQVEKISSQILVTEFQSNQNTTVISCYCPHNARPEEDVDTFFGDFRSVLSRVPAHNFLSLLGDFNARP